jgi:hypothetical protein
MLVASAMDDLIFLLLILSLAALITLSIAVWGRQPRPSSEGLR